MIARRRMIEIAAGSAAVFSVGSAARAPPSAARAAPRMENSGAGGALLHPEGNVLF